MKIWDMHHFSLQKSIDKINFEVFSACYSYDGFLIAVVTKIKEISIYDSKKFEKTQRISGDNIK